jgi:hypothetical protein
MAGTLELFPPGRGADARAELDRIVSENVATARRPRLLAHRSVDRRCGQSRAK